MYRGPAPCHSDPATREKNLEPFAEFTVSLFATLRAIRSEANRLRVTTPGAERRRPCHALPPAPPAPSLAYRIEMRRWVKPGITRKIFSRVCGQVAQPCSERLRLFIRPLGNAIPHCGIALPVRRAALGRGAPSWCSRRCKRKREGHEGPPLPSGDEPCRAPCGTQTSRSAVCASPRHASRQARAGRRPRQGGTPAPIRGLTVQRILPRRATCHRYLSRCRWPNSARA